MFEQNGPGVTFWAAVAVEFWPHLIAADLTKADVKVLAAIVGHQNIYGQTAWPKGGLARAASVGRSAAYAAVRRLADGEFIAPESGPDWQAVNRRWFEQRRTSNRFHYREAPPGKVRQSWHDKNGWSTQEPATVEQEQQEEQPARQVEQRPAKVEPARVVTSERKQKAQRMKHLFGMTTDARDLMEHTWWTDKARPTDADVIAFAASQESDRPNPWHDADLAREAVTEARAELRRLVG
jgi:hypothetical protein